MSRSSLFLDPTIKFEKVAYSTRLEDDPDEWPAAILRESYKQLPFLKSFETDLELDRVDSSRGYAVGKMLVYPAGLTKQAGHDRWLGTSVADHDERRGLEKREQDSHQLRIELGDFFRQIPVGILLRFPVEPYDLGPVEDVKFAEIVRTPIYFRDVTDMRPLVV